VKRPDFLERKGLLFDGRTRAEDAIRWGHRYREEGRLHDAVAFYRRARHEEGLQEILRLAVDSGDLLLFREAAEGLSLPWIEHEGLRSLAERAMELGRWHDARNAFDKLGDAGGMRRATEALEALMGRSPSRGDTGGSGPEVGSSAV
jgi:hypothetical protein